MKRTRYILGVLCLIICVGTTRGYGQTQELQLQIDQKKVQIDKPLVVTLIGKDLDQIIGTDIELLYDQEYFLLLSKENLFPQNQIIDLQTIHDTFKDEPGKIRVVFGLKGQLQPWTGEERPLVQFIFEARRPGEGKLSVSENSRLVEVVESRHRWMQPDFNTAPNLISIYGWGSFTGKIHLEDEDEINGTNAFCFQGETPIEERVPDRDGNFLFNQLPDGSYRVRIEKSGYLPSEHSFEIVEGLVATHEFHLEKIKDEEPIPEDPKEEPRPGEPGDEDPQEEPNHEDPKKEAPKENPSLEVPKDKEEDINSGESDNNGLIPRNASPRKGLEEESKPNALLKVDNLTLYIDSLPISVDNLKILSLDIHNSNQKEFVLRSKVYQISLPQEDKDLWIPFKIKLNDSIENPEAVGIYEYLEAQQKWAYRGGEIQLLEGTLEGLVQSNRIFAIMENRDYQSFEDVEGRELKEIIRKLAMRGLILGFGDGTFRPNQPITREEFLAVLIRLFEVPVMQAYDNGDNTSWFSDIRYTSIHLGILQGDLARNTGLSMEEMIDLIDRMKDIMRMEGMAGQGEKISKEEIESEKTMTRAEAVAFLYRVFEL